MKKRSTAATAASQSGPQQSQSFFFVDPASSTREKRAHVMRHHIQAKRKQNMLAGHADRHSRREPRVYPWMKKSNANSDLNDSKPLRGVITTVRMKLFQRYSIKVLMFSRSLHSTKLKRAVTQSPSLQIH